MNETQFVQTHAALWYEVEETIKNLKGKGVKASDKQQLDIFISQYHQICGHLSYSRTYLGAAETTRYLNHLVASAHQLIYTNETASIRKLLRFFFRGFPKLVCQQWKVVLFSTAIFLLGGFLSFLYTWINPDNASAFLPQQILDSINFEGNGGAGVNSPVMSSFIFTNNIKVGFTAFALGITLGAGTIWLLATNGFMLGSLAALAHGKQMALSFWSLILPHGIIELFAIFVCGAAGLLTGYSILFPGEYSRKDSLVFHIRIAARLILGTIPLFIIAGLIEGYITPSALPEGVKLLVSALTLVLLALYLSSPAWPHAEPGTPSKP